MDTTQRTSILSWLAMFVGLTITLVVGIAIIGSIPSGSIATIDSNWLKSQSPGSQKIGVRAVITSGDVSIERDLLKADFTLKENQQLDALLPSGPSKATLTVTFSSRAVRRAQIGAEIKGGSLIISRDGKTLLSDYAGSDSRIVLTPSQYLPARPIAITFEFSRDSSGPAQFRAVWKPEGSPVALPLPSTTSAILTSKEVHGYALVQQYSCVACHESANQQLQSNLDVSPAPILGSIGARAKPAWIRNWIADPQKVKAGSRMPKLFHGSDIDQQEIEDLTHFLVSMSGPIDDEQISLDTDLISTGMVMYHAVGCFACHGPLEPINKLPGGYKAGPTPAKVYTPLGDFGAKTTVYQLAAFLADPVSTRPSGRMPSLNLSELESKAIASYLISKAKINTQGLSNEPFALDSKRVNRGRDLFAGKGCANCHSLGSDRSAISTTLIVPSLEAVIDADTSVPNAKGCLSEIAESRTPEFALSSSQKQDIITYLLTVPDQLSNVAPQDELAAAMDRFNCLACHTFAGIGGPEPAVAQYFKVHGEVDLGDEGRLPPDIGDIGAKLHPDWLHRILEEAAVSRSYMATRMPQFGKLNIGILPDLFMSASGVTQSANDPIVKLEDSVIGRKLTGVGGFNCIQCHSIAGKDASDLPGPDLAFMPERLRYDYFVQWLMNPKLFRSDTRMPTFFFEGLSGNNEHYNGNAQKQIDALWGYLSQGEFLPLPDGLSDPGSFMLEVSGEPIILRTFMEEVGARTIAVGYPEQLHCAFDADNCKFAVAWEGQFLSAQAVWGGRGGSETDPEQGIEWLAPKGPVFIISDVLPQEWPEEIDTGAVRFRGYSLDEYKYPTFNYEIRGNGTLVKVSEKPRAVIQDGRAYLLREFVLQGKAETKIIVNLSGTTVANSSSSLSKLDDEGHYELTLDTNGSTTFSVEVAW